MKKDINVMNVVSIVVPVYNPPELYFGECVHSLLNQTYSALQIILIDDGSDEPTKAACDRYACEDTRIRVIHQQNAGVSAARNCGIEHASGRYLAFVDADDRVRLNFIESLVKGIEGCDLAICGVDHSEEPMHNGIVTRREFFSSPEMYMGLQYINYVWNKLYCLHIIRENRIHFEQSVRLGEDALFVGEYLHHCQQIQCLREPLYLYTDNEYSAVRRYQSQFWLWERRVIQTQWEMFSEQPLEVKNESALFRWLYNKYRYVIYYYRSQDRHNLSILGEIQHDPLFRILIRLSRKRRCQVFSKRERIHLWLWRNFFTPGMILGYNYTHYREARHERKERS